MSRCIRVLSSALLGGLALVPAMASAEPVDGDALLAAWRRDPDRHPQVPNVAGSGYRAGLAEPPTVAFVNDVVADFGADPTGTADSTAAFWRAMDDAQERGGGAVRIPAGTFRIDGFLWLRHDGVVLRGESRATTVLRFTRPLSEVVGEDATSTKSKYSWLGGLVWMSGPRTFDVPATHARAYAAGSLGPDWRRGRYTDRRSEFWVDADHPAQVLTVPVADAEEGDRLLRVADPGKVRPGDRVLLNWSIAGIGHPFARLVAGSPFVAANYPWSAHPGTSLEDAKGYGWAVLVEDVTDEGLVLAQPLRTPVRLGWSPRVIDLAALAPLRDAGIEDLTLQLDSDNGADYRHLQDRGWNGVFVNRAVDCWVRRVTIADGENGVLVAAAKHVTVSDIRLEDRRGRANVWHHGFAARVQSSDIVFEDFVFDVARRIDHGIGSEAWSSGLAWRRGTMHEGTFDSHRVLPFDQVRTDIVVENPAGSGSGGDGDDGPHAGRRLVHWNVETVQRGTWVHHPELLSQGAFVGVRGPELAGCPGVASTMCGTLAQKESLVLERGTVPRVRDLVEAQRSALREDRGAVVLALPRPHTSQPRHGAPRLRIEGTAPAGRGLARAELRRGGTVVAVATALPWDFAWTDVPLGEHLLRAHLLLDDGSEIVSTPTRLVRAERRRVDESDPDLRLLGAWQTVADDRHEGGRALRSDREGDAVEYTFRGTRVAWVGYNVANTTSNGLRVLLDGREIARVSDRSGEAFRIPVWISPELPDGIHTIRFEVGPHAAGASTRGFLDYLEIDVTGPVGTSVPASLALAPTDVALGPGGSVAFAAVLLDHRGAPFTPQPVAIAWSVDGGGSVGADGTFVSDGTPGTFAVTARAAGFVATATVVIEAVDAGVYLESDGLAVIEAEHAREMLDRGDAASWTIADAIPGFSGTGYAVLPASAPANAGWDNGAELVFAVRLSRGGRYYLNVRRIAPGSGQDSLHVGVDGRSVATKVFEGTSTGWAWASSAAVVDLGELAPGVRTIHLRRREPGMAVDRIALASDPALLPRGTTAVGPPESDRADAPAPTPFAAWIAAAGASIPADRRGPADVALADGVPNALRFFLGLDATARATPAELPRPEWTATGLALAFVRHDRAAAVPFEIEGSRDLASWFPLDPGEPDSTDLGDGRRRVVVGIPASGPDPLFVRLKVSLP